MADVEVTLQVKDLATTTIKNAMACLDALEREFKDLRTSQRTGLDDTALNTFEQKIRDSREEVVRLNESLRNTARETRALPSALPRIPRLNEIAPRIAPARNAFERIGRELQRETIGPMLPEAQLRAERASRWGSRIEGAGAA